MWFTRRRQTASAPSGSHDHSDTRGVTLPLSSDRWALPTVTDERKKNKFMLSFFLISDQPTADCGTSWSNSRFSSDPGNFDQSKFMVQTDEPAVGSLLTHFGLLINEHPQVTYLSWNIYDLKPRTLFKRLFNIWTSRLSDFIWKHEAIKKKTFVSYLLYLILFFVWRKTSWRT